MNRGRRVPCSSSTFCHSLGMGGQLEVATLLPSVLRNYSVLILVAMEQEGKIVKILSELNFSKCPERFGFCEGSSLIYWLFSCLSSSGISLCLNSKGSVLLHMLWLAVQHASQLPSLPDLPQARHTSRSAAQPRAHPAGVKTFWTTGAKFIPHSSETSTPAIVGCPSAMLWWIVPGQWW